MQFDALGDTFAITMSFGLCSIQQDTTASEILKRSDENLYAAKTAGRVCGACQRLYCHRRRNMRVRLVAAELKIFETVSVD